METKELKEKVKEIKDCKKRVENTRHRYKEKLADVRFNMDKYLEKHMIEGRSNKEQRDSIEYIETKDLLRELKELESVLSYKHEMLELYKLEKQLDVEDIRVRVVVDFQNNGWIQAIPEAEADLTEPTEVV